MFLAVAGVQRVYELDSEGYQVGDNAESHDQSDPDLRTRQLPSQAEERKPVFELDRLPDDNRVLVLRFLLDDRHIVLRGHPFSKGRDRFGLFW